MPRAECPQNTVRPGLSPSSTDSTHKLRQVSLVKSRAGQVLEKTRARYPFVLGLALIWMLTVDTLTRIPLGPLSASGALTLGGAAVCLLLLPITITARLRHGYLKRGPGVPFALALFVGYAIFRLVLTPSAEGLQNVAVYSSFVVAMAITRAQITPSGATQTARLMRWTAVVVSLVFLTSFLAGSTLYGERAYALTGLIFIAVLIPHRPRKLAYRAAPFLVAAVIALSLSRTATAIALVMLVFLSIRGKRGFRLLRSTVFAALAAAAAYALITYYAPFRDRFIGGDNAASIGNVELNTSGRSVLWNMTVRSAESNPLFGNGPGTATTLISSAFKNISHPHNEYLRVFHDFGYTGVALFVLGLVILLARTFQRALRYDHPIHWAAILGLLAVVSAAFTDNVIVYPFVMIPLGVLVGASAGLTHENAPTTRP